ncbi:hypothetical protein KDX38_10830 [Pseudomonas sp. CDFA 602]|uniref:hypothetical protein n=1 Tax=Pseudomonas californiensis TaxID=2829823 RepID=UPI001E3BB247|nr:hypothetical protein [Pseudomonas californiensis]MCD5994189.1 hypothetical protein [Pseudomonas californiensis]MCD5999712.1 hypothetical protein [Pseudomonas californiensis]
MKIDWSKAPEWAVAHGLHAFGGTIQEVWIGEQVYLGLNGPAAFGYGGGDGFEAHNHTRAQFSYETSRPKEWTGEGPPPAGTECELQHSTWSENHWEKRKVLYLGDAYLITASPGDDEERCSHTKEIKFRPLRTAEQIAAEEREKAVKQMQKDCACYANADLFADLYDAGYRKQVTP